MVAQRLSACNPGLYKVASGRYLLLKIDSRIVRRIDLLEDVPNRDYDIDNYNHVFVTELPFISLIKQSQVGRNRK